MFEEHINKLVSCANASEYSCQLLTDEVVLQTDILEWWNPDPLLLKQTLAATKGEAQPHTRRDFLETCMVSSIFARLVSPPGF